MTFMIIAFIMRQSSYLMGKKNLLVELTNSPILYYFIYLFIFVK